jgi:hypothetical protein
MEAPEPRRLPVRMDLAPAESGLGFALRALRANGVAFDRGMQWLGLERHRPMDHRTVLRIAWSLNVDPGQLGKRLVTQDGSRAGWVRFAGMRFRRQVATNKLYAKVCPQCLREHGVAKLSWQLRAAVGCAQHGYSLIWLCPHCGQSIGWSRPDVDICRCGRHFKIEPAAPLEPEVQAWQNWLEAALANVVPPEPVALPVAMLHLSIDGAFRIVEALGLCAGPGTSVRNALAGCKTPRGLGVVVQRGLQRLKVIEADAGAPMRLSEVANQQALAQIAADAAAEEDRRLAWWLIQSMRSGVDPGPTRAGTRPRGQLPLFIA